MFKTCFNFAFIGREDSKTHKRRAVAQIIGMKETGIVRRIDELGRVVIPKEIRKTLRLNQGDPLEIYTEKEQLLLKKYSPIGALDNFADALAQSLYEATAFTSLVCDLDMVLASKGVWSRELEGKALSQKAVDKIRQRRVEVITDIKDHIWPVDGELKDIKSQLIMPVSSNGDLVGAIILLSKNSEVDAKTLTIASFACDFLSKQA